MVKEIALEIVGEPIVKFRGNGAPELVLDVISEVLPDSLLRKHGFQIPGSKSLHTG